MKHKKIAALLAVAAISLSTTGLFFPGVFSYAYASMACNYSQQTQIRPEGSHSRMVNGTFVAKMTLGNWTTVFHAYGIYNFPSLTRGDAAQYMSIDGAGYNRSGTQWGRHLPYGVHLNSTELWVLPRSC